jgi:hypothetical protein
LDAQPPSNAIKTETARFMDFPHSNAQRNDFCQVPDKALQNETLVPC